MARDPLPRVPNGQTRTETPGWHEIFFLAMEGRISLDASLERLMDHLERAR